MLPYELLTDRPHLLIINYKYGCIDRNQIKVAVYTYEEMEQYQSQSTTRLDSAMLKQAAKIYQTYRQIRRQLPKPPIGVAIHRKTLRGQLVFTERPILLPGESWILIDQLDSTNK